MLSGVPCSAVHRKLVRAVPCSATHTKMRTVVSCPVSYKEIVGATPCSDKHCTVQGHEQIGSVCRDKSEWARKELTEALGISVGAAR